MSLVLRPIVTQAFKNVYTTNQNGKTSSQTVVFSFSDKFFFHFYLTGIVDAAFGATPTLGKNSSKRRNLGSHKLKVK